MWPTQVTTDGIETCVRFGFCRITASDSGFRGGVNGTDVNSV